MQIRDLEQWPPSESATSGPKLKPDDSTAIITGVRAEGKHVKLSIDDQGQGHSITIGSFNDALAKRVARTLKDAIGKTIQDAGMLDILD
jgi:hypothetical protein